jgi:plastocyanin
MGSVGKVAFILILVAGTITGIVTYYLFTAAIPQPGTVVSLYRQNLPPAEQTKENKPAAAAIDESKFTNKVAITILKGASTQGNPSYSPDTTKASTNALVTWTNDDTVPHTATSGSGLQDPNSGKLFDSDIMSPNQKYSLPASKIGQGEHPFYCKLHPYMTGKISIA